VAVTSLDGIVAGMLPPYDVNKAAVTAEAAGVYHSSILLAGLPGAAAAANTRTFAAPGSLTSYAGSIQFPATVAGKNIHLASLEASHGGNIGAIAIWDRIWQCDTLAGGIVVTTTTAQTITSFGTLQPRDLNGATSGEGVMAALEVQTTTGNAGAISNMSLSYTNSAGTAGRTAGMLYSFPITANAGTIVPFTLAAGDTGIRSIQSITLGTSLVSGTVSLICYRQIATIGTPLANTSYSKDALALGLPRMYDTSCPFMVYVPTGTAVGVVDAQISYTQN
jgi:hypothetical protein